MSGKWDSEQRLFPTNKQNKCGKVKAYRTRVLSFK
jgi:hypothetical protein